MVGVILLPDQLPEAERARHVYFVLAVLIQVLDDDAVVQAHRPLEAV